MNNHFSIIIPTYLEAANLPRLVEEIAKQNFAEHTFEVIIVDDNSQDGTHELVNLLKEKYSWLKLLIRTEGRNLSAAILDGFKQANNSIVITMDADLSHPPERIGALLATLINHEADIVIGSRYVEGGSVDPSWPISRKIASRFSAFLARYLVASNVLDPLSGFLAIRRNKIIDTNNIDAIGWKIGLELIVKCRCQKIYEIPIHFRERTKGKSKLNITVAMLYLYHLLRLCYFKLITT